MTDLNKYENENPWYGGILFCVINWHNCFLSIKFGDVVEDDCDDYIMIDFLQINGEPELECFDGAMFEFNQDKSGFNGCILKAIPDALAYIESDISDLEPIMKL